MAYYDGVYALFFLSDFNFGSEIYGDWASFKYDGEMREKNFIGCRFRNELFRGASNG